MEDIRDFKVKYGTNAKVGFIGCGNMANAIVKGILEAKLFDSENLMISSRTDSKNLKEMQCLGVQTTLDNSVVVNQCPIVFLCVKPACFESVAENLLKKYDLDAENYCARSFVTTFVSILAGTSIRKIKKAIPIFDSYIRAMPNTPLQVLAGCTALTKPILGDRTTEKSQSAVNLNFKIVESIFKSLGIAEIVEESKFDAVTGVSGSGPAYAYIIIEALSDAGVKQGLSREVATKFAAQTLFGASKTVLESGLHPGVLKDQVTSSGGTTIHAIHELEKGGIRNTLINAVEAATLRSLQMSKD